MFLKREKRKKGPIRIANDVFSRVRRMIRPIRSHRVCEFRAKIPTFYRRSHLAAPSLCDCLADIQLEKFFLEKFFS